MYCVSLPLVFLCVVAAFLVMFISFWFENLMIENRRDAGDDSVFAYVVTSIPGAVYGVVVWIMNIYYRYFATVLTEWGMLVVINLLNFFLNHFFRKPPNAVTI